jgi:Protein of unknown function (DUF2752)
MSVDGIVNRRVTAVAIWGLVGAGAVYLFSFEPGRNGIFPTCPFRTLTGLNCPGCGTTRGLHQLLHGHVIAAFEFNPLTMLLLPVLGYFLIAYTSSAITGRPMPRISIPDKFVWAFSLIVLGFWIFRNTPLYPFPS